MRMKASCETSSASIGPDDANGQRVDAPLEAVVERLAAAGVAAADGGDQRGIVVSRGVHLGLGRRRPGPELQPVNRRELCRGAEHRCRGRFDRHAGARVVHRTRSKVRQYEDEPHVGCCPLASRGGRLAAVGGRVAGRNAGARAGQAGERARGRDRGGDRAGSRSAAARPWVFRSTTRLTRPARTTRAWRCSATPPTSTST